MENLLDKIKFHLTEFKFVRLNTQSKTENFHLPQLGIPYARIYYPIEGEGYIILNGQKHILEAGKIYLIAPYAPVRVGCPKYLVKYWGHFNVFMPDSQLDIFTFTEPLRIINDEKPEFTISLCEILCRSYRISRETPGHALNDMEGRSALTLLLMPFIKEEQNTLLVSQKISRLAPLLSYIEKHLSEGLSLQQLADFCNLNPVYLSNLFAAKMGLPLMKYCNQRSIHRALELMWSGKYSFAEVAYRVGAENVTAFSRLFKKHTGVSPREMQKQIGLFKVS